MSTAPVTRLHRLPESIIHRRGDLFQRLIQFSRESGISSAGSVIGLASHAVGVCAASGDPTRIGGSMQIGTAPGRGARCIIRIPIGLAVMQAIIPDPDRLIRLLKQAAFGALPITSLDD